MVRSLRLAVAAAACCLSLCALAACTATAVPLVPPVSPPDTAWLTAVAAQRTVMVVGDSVTQGLEGDVTWRYDLASLSTARSPVDLVDVARSYQYATDSYDGLHPNGAGEWVIADAFANSLARDFGFGPGSAYVPGSPRLVQLSQAGAPTLTPDADGIDASWAHVFGAAGYNLEVADITAGQALGAGTELPAAVVADSWHLTCLIPGDRYEVAVQAIRGYQRAPFSPPATATVGG